MKKDNDLYNVFKMQLDDATRLAEEADDTIKLAKYNNERHNHFKEASNKKLQENKAWIESLGIKVDFDRSDSQKKTANAQKDLDKAKETEYSFEAKAVSYEELVELAHSRGYVDTAISDILTEAEIQQADQRLASIENEFSKLTRLNKTDIAFLITAVALQVIRQYVITPFSDKGSADKQAKTMEERYGKNGKLRGRYYIATEATIIGQNKVPYDIIAGSKKFGIGKGGKGLDGNSHRYRSLGHDPILGYIFGTANIVTNTATWWNGTSHHIRYQPNRNGVSIPVLESNAKTEKVFEYVVDRFKGDRGKIIIVEAIVKQYLHLKSDTSTAGLPIPFLQAISPDFTQTLAEYGLDAIALKDIAKQAAGAELINFIISTLHSLICVENGEFDRKLYEVRTRKIILISNAVASSSNVIAVGISSYANAARGNSVGAKNSLKYLDVGGLLVTIKHLFTDLNFISKVKEEFVQSKLDAQLLAELDKLDKYL